MRNNHRARIVTREDYDSPWSLPMWRNPNVKKRIHKCAECNPKVYIRKEKAIRKFELSLMKEN